MSGLFRDIGFLRVCLIIIPISSYVYADEHWMFHASEIPSRQPSSVSRTNFTTKDFLRTLEKNGFGENPHLKSTRTYPYTRSHKVQMHSISNKNTNPTSASGKKLHESTWRQNEEWCSWFRGLAPRQHRMCLENPDLVAAAMRGTDIAVRECQRQFSYDRWNCSLILTNVVVRSRTRSDQHLSYVNQKGVGGYRKEDIKGEVLARGLRNATREGAFVHAIMSAGIAHAVTVACRTGKLNGCHCDKSISKLDIAMEILREKIAWDESKYTLNAAKAAFDAVKRRKLYGGFYSGLHNGSNSAFTTGIAWEDEVEQISWGGCSDDVKFGVRFSRRFVEAPYKDVPLRKRTPRDDVNLHNGEVGRRMIQSMTRVHCRCHGMSGSCTTQTCWMQMASFEDIGDALKRKHTSAIQALDESKRRRRLRHMTDSGRLRRVPKTELAFINPTPNLCRENRTLGMAGTAGRECLKHSEDAGDCRYLCCGRGYNTRQVVIRKHCKCKFIWCCEVLCEICSEMTTKYTCKE